MEPVSPAEVERLPVGTIVWPWVQDQYAPQGRVNDSPLVVNKGRVLLPIAVLPEKATGKFPDDGDPAAAFAKQFVVVSKGKGKLPTHGTASRLAIAWRKSTHESVFRATGEDRMYRLLRESRGGRGRAVETQSGPIVFETLDDFYEAARLAEANKWIKKAVGKPGRCANPGDSDCPKGSPQYRLAMRFKKGGDIYKAHNKRAKK